MNRATLVLALLVLASTPAALAHTGAPTWTLAKAERIVVREATVNLPAATRDALRQELLTVIPRFRILENLAWDMGDHQASSRIHNIRYRYSTALRQVVAGLRITSADCSGTGRGTGDRFGHFRCSTLSERMLVPTVEVSYDESGLPRVVELEPGVYGPYEATLVVHALGPGSIAYRQLGQATSGRLEVSRA